MQEEERIARIGSNDPESHLGIPYSHASAKITIKYRVDTVLGVGGRGGVGGGYTTVLTLKNKANMDTS
jgi:hypothetical protein